MTTLNKNETKELARIQAEKMFSTEGAQRAADIWMRSAPTTAAKQRRQAAVKAIGLNDTIQFL